MKRWLESLSVLLAFCVATAADFDAGLRAYQTRDYATAFKEWLPLAEAGDADVQFRLGVMFDNGQGVAKDKVQAAEWYRRAAEQGNKNAASLLG